MDPALILYIILLCGNVIVGIVDIWLAYTKRVTVTDMANSFIEVRILIIMIQSLFPLLINIHLRK